MQLNYRRDTQYKPPRSVYLDGSRFLGSSQPDQSRSSLEVQEVPLVSVRELCCFLCCPGTVKWRLSQLDECRKTVKEK